MLPQRQLNQTTVDNPTLPGDQWTYARPLTDVELGMLALQFNKESPGYICTCASCVRKTTCVLAYDSYNTNGDCLYDK